MQPFLQEGRFCNTQQKRLLTGDSTTIHGDCGDEQSLALKDGERSVRRRGTGNGPRRASIRRVSVDCKDASENSTIMGL